ncbi:HU family DNA-binding protein [Anaerorhabdus furcosa]|uniref:DNA-binding protein HU-beta n=1 Tax=Anaerorhabdus furcosa TaxID=118967 RepID=A0A1T4L4T0_9FIRM|nr:HU family DNA-binding protein [Anaerorhabdus furcosa]SJZ49577.1 DNA-binding protein HU-beta [Anaerorhabdus furcosa]
MADVKTKKVLAEELAGEMNLTKKDATEAVNFLFAQMTKTLKKGGTVDINGFGKFTVKKRAARTGINPLTKEKIKIKATKVPAFKASKTLKDIVK